MASALGGSASDWNALVVAAITLVIVLIVCYMCVQLYVARRPPAGPAGLERLTMWPQYRPACSGRWLPDRRWCTGLTSGDMPSIEEGLGVSWAPCSGALGVPPPVYQ